MNAFGDATMALALFLLDPADGLARLRRRLRRRRAASSPTVANARRARPARRRGREVGAAPAPDVASRRDGGPDAGQRPHPRGDDGHRRRLPDRPHARRSSRRRRTSRTSPPGSARSTLLDGRADRARPDRHQARDRLLDDVADRLHVPRRRASAPTRAAMFHLMTHAFFKALLFLARRASSSTRSPASRTSARWAGSRELLPCTYCAFLVGALALVGIPPFSGFFSKDPILAAALDERRLVRLRPLRRRARRRVPDRPLHVPADLPRLLRRAVARSCASTCTHAARRLEGRSSMGVAGRRARRARGGRRLASSSRRSGTPVDDWLDPVAEPLVEPTGRAGARRERARRRARPRRDRASPGRSTAAQRRRRCRSRWRAARAQVLLRRALRRASSTGRRSRSRTALCALRRAAARRRLARASVGRASRELGRRVAPRSRPASCAPTRSRSPPSLAVLAVVFIAVR